MLSAWSTRLVVMLTTWPLPWVTICRMARWVMWKNPARLTAVIAAIVVERVVREWLADEDPGVVDQGVDPSEPIERLLDHALGRSRPRRCHPAR